MPLPPQFSRLSPHDPRAVESARAVAASDVERLAPNMVTNFSAVLTGFSTPGRAIVPETKRVNLGFAQAEMITPHMEVGDTLFLIFLASERLASPMQRALNPWPQYQVHCATVFDSKQPAERGPTRQSVDPLAGRARGGSPGIGDWSEALADCSHSIREPDSRAHTGGDWPAGEASAQGYGRVH